MQQKEWKKKLNAIDKIFDDRPFSLSLILKTINSEQINDKYRWLFCMFNINRKAINHAASHDPRKTYRNLRDADFWIGGEGDGVETVEMRLIARSSYGGAI